MPTTMFIGTEFGPSPSTFDENALLFESSTSLGAREFPSGVVEVDGTLTITDAATSAAAEAAADRRASSAKSNSAEPSGETTSSGGIILSSDSDESNSSWFVSFDSSSVSADSPICVVTTTNVSASKAYLLMSTRSAALHPVSQSARPHPVGTPSVGGDATGSPGASVESTGCRIQKFGHARSCSGGESQHSLVQIGSAQNQEVHKIRHFGNRKKVSGRSRTNEGEIEYR